MSAPDSSERGTDPAPVGLLDVYENLAGRHRFGERKPIVYTHDEDGNIVPYRGSLPDQPKSWGVICFWGALLLVATVALVKLFAEKG